MNNFNNQIHESMRLVVEEILKKKKVKKLLNYNGISFENVYQKALVSNVSVNKKFIIILNEIKQKKFNKKKIIVSSIEEKYFFETLFKINNIKSCNVIIKKKLFF